MYGAAYGRPWDRLTGLPQVSLAFFTDCGFFTLRFAENHSEQRRQLIGVNDWGIPASRHTMPQKVHIYPAVRADTAIAYPTYLSNDNDGRRVTNV